MYQPFRVDFFTMAGNCMILFFSMVQCRLFLDMYQNLLLSSLLRPVDKSQFSNAADILDQVSEGRYSFVTNYIGHWYFEELLASNSSTTHLEKLRNITLQVRDRVLGLDQNVHKFQRAQLTIPVCNLGAEVKMVDTDPNSEF